MANNHMVRFDNGAFFDYNSATSLGINGTGLFLRVNDKNKLITGKTVYDKIEEFKRKSGNYGKEDCIRSIKDYLCGKVVIAGYGNFRAYRIGRRSTINY